MLEFHYSKIIHIPFKNILDFDKSELFFINPTSKVINLLIGNKNYKIEPKNAKIVNVIEPIVSLKSNCLFLRPTVLLYWKLYRCSSFIILHVKKILILPLHNSKIF